MPAQKLQVHVQRPLKLCGAGRWRLAPYDSPFSFSSICLRARRLASRRLLVCEPGASGWAPLGWIFLGALGMALSLAPPTIWVMSPSTALPVALASNLAVLSGRPVAPAAPCASAGLNLLS